MQPLIVWSIVSFLLFLSTILVSLTPASNGLKITLLEEISKWLSQTVMEFMPNPPNEHLDWVYPKEVSLDQLSSISSSVPLGEIFCKHGILFIGYTDDSQNYLSFRPIKDDVTPQKACTDCLETCLKEV